MRVRPTDLYCSPLDQPLQWNRVRFNPTADGGSYWTNWGDGHMPCGWAYDEVGWVVTRGLAMHNATALSMISGIFMLPEPIRPRQDLMFHGMGSRSGGVQPMRIDVRADGWFAYNWENVTGTIDYLSLAECRWQPTTKYEPYS